MTDTPDQNRSTDAQTSARKLAKKFKFLDALRESGRTNMSAAAPYLQARFGMSSDNASAITQQWMKTFDRKSSPFERAKSALKGLSPGAAGKD